MAAREEMRLAMSDWPCRLLAVAISATLVAIVACDIWIADDPQARVFLESVSDLPARWSARHRQREPAATANQPISTLGLPQRCPRLKRVGSRCSRDCRRNSAPVSRKAREAPPSAWFLAVVYIR